MIKVIIGNNVTRNEVIIDENTTLREALENNEVRYDGGIVHLDGTPLQAGQIDKTFSDLGVTERCYLIAVVKTDNAA